jgi:cation transport ATPase
VSDARIQHETRGRLRLAVGERAADAAFTAGLSAVAGVMSLRVNRRLGCVVITHDGLEASRNAILDALDALGANDANDANDANEPPGPFEAPLTVESTTSLPTGSALAPRTLGSEADLDTPAARRRGGRRPGARGPAAQQAPVASDTPIALATWGPAVLAAALPLLPRGWRAGGGIAVVAARTLVQRRRLAEEPVAVLLDAASLAALALGGHPLVVSASVLMRTASEVGAARMVQQADLLLDRLLPTAAPRYLARAPGAGRWVGMAPDALVPGHRVRLSAGDVVPIDGWVYQSTASLLPHAVDDPGLARAVARGDHVTAGERVLDGRLELHVETPAADSRLERLRAHVHHAAGTSEPAGRLTPDLHRMLALPFTGAALVFGLTGDTARTAAMLQADPVQGLDLALPVAREAARVTLARHGLLTTGLETIERLARAQVLVLQDTAVLGSGRWRVESVRTRPGGHESEVRGWLAALAGWPGELPQGACLSDRQVRTWRREGGLLSIDGREIHLADDHRLRRIWGAAAGASTDVWAGDPAEAGNGAGACDSTEARAGEPVRGAALRLRFAFVAAGRVVARVELASPLRDGVSERLAELASLGFQRIAVIGEAGDPPPADIVPTAERIGPGPAERAAWLAEATRDGSPLVLVHTALRDLLPPGSVGLCPVLGDAGAHGVLLGDPLASLVTARRVALAVHRRLRVQQGAATITNAALMTASALRWAPPIVTATLHHGFAALLLLDSLRLERLGAARTAEPTSTTRSDG